jgi:hypothetical protein
MRASLFLATLLIALFAVGGIALAGQQVYGKGVTGAETIKASELMANADDYVGKTVRVEGIAVGVCAHRGCWINISSDTEGEVVRLKVTDGEIVFPPEIVGEQVIAEGVWTSNKLDLDTTKRVCAHRAEKAGEKFDPESVTECMTVYQITGTGAEVRASKDAVDRAVSKG